MNLPHPRKWVSWVIIFLVSSGFMATAQLPTVTVRLTNPTFNCETLDYCLDVEFKSDAGGSQLFGINVRFFYDDNVLEFLSMGDYAEGYGPYDPDPPIVTTYSASSGTVFGFSGPAEFVNGAVQLTSTTSIFLTSEWTKLFNMCFQIDDPNAFDIESFCPPIVWDLEEDPANGGFITGSNGVVVNVLIPPDQISPTTENVVQYNWAYDGVPGPPFGFIDPTVCIPTICTVYDYGDAPEGVIAYPDLGVMGAFPTCEDPTYSGFIRHVIEDPPLMFFGWAIDGEPDGNGGLCNPYTAYNNDEYFNDVDAGLLMPAPYTITPSGYAAYTPGSYLVFAGDTVTWGSNLDIQVTNNTQGTAYVNVLIDWNRDGVWQNDPNTTYEGNFIPEHCLVNFPVPQGFTGPLSSLSPPDIYSTSKSGHIWVRFSISDIPVNQPDNPFDPGWDGSGEYAWGETEDYLLFVSPTIPVSGWALALGIFLIAAFAIFRIRKG